VIGRSIGKLEAGAAGDEALVIGRGARTARVRASEGRRAPPWFNWPFGIYSYRDNVQTLKARLRSPRPSARAGRAHWASSAAQPP